MSIRLIAGLGNPGREHARDRHNVGFWFVERLARAHGAELRKEAKYHGLAARVTLPQGDVWLLAPQTYMNLSGKSVVALARFHKIAIEETLVVHDELDFDPGVAKLKLGGGVAGHNGLRDITEQFGGPGFWRLRIGIGHPGERDAVTGYVLSSPSADERAAIEASLARGLEVVPELVAGSFEVAMHKLHTKG
jgi:PTH1 family peptidyl-tRNA hydrolase